MENQQGDFLYALEDTSCMNRFICGPNRPWEINVTQGAEAGGPQVAKFERPFRLPMGACKCCCYQEVLSTMPTGQANGSVVETFWMFVPMLNVVGPGGDVEYKISMPTCMGGLCVNIFAEGLCNCRIPFYIFKPDSGTTKEEKVGNITKIWAGLGSELFTDADKFELNFPADASQESKARLLGATFLINQVCVRARLETEHISPPCPALLAPTKRSKDMWQQIPRVPRGAASTMQHFIV